MGQKVWNILFHRKIKNDLKKIDPSLREKIKKTIWKKLSTAPKEFGQPLTDKLFGYWKLRVDDFRVIYKIVDNKILVLILKIGMRKNSQVYKDFEKRLKNL